jgi:hypothetical protein
MAQAAQRRRADAQDNRTDELRSSPTMSRLLDAMEAGDDIGHYGQFTFVTVARHFMDEEAILSLLERQPEMDRPKANALLEHVKERGYNPPHRERILDQQARGGFRIIENPQDPDCGNLYRELEFPDEVYEDINQYYEEKAEAR